MVNIDLEIHREQHEQDIRFWQPEHILHNVLMIQGVGSSTILKSVRILRSETCINHQQPSKQSPDQSVNTMQQGTHNRKSHRTTNEALGADIQGL